MRATVRSVARPFPKVLLPDFDADVLTGSESTIAVIDSLGEIVWVNPSWERFALENGGGSYGDGRGSYFDGIAQPMREFYRSVFLEATATSEVFDEVYECSSPAKRRIYHCRVLPVGTRALIVEHSLLAEEEHGTTDEATLAARYSTADGTLLQCSHCRRVRGPSADAWSWMSRWAAKSHSRTSHVICPLCADFYWGRRP